MRYNPFADPDARNLQFQLLIGIQYAFYELLGIALFLGASLFFIQIAPLFPLVPIIVGIIECLRNIRRLKRLSASLEKSLLGLESDADAFN